MHSWHDGSPTGPQDRPDSTVAVNLLDVVTLGVGETRVRSTTDMRSSSPARSTNRRFSSAGCPASGEGSIVSQ
jgi:hypothetical protein